MKSNLLFHFGGVFSLMTAERNFTPVVVYGFDKHALVFSWEVSKIATIPAASSAWSAE